MSPISSRIFLSRLFMLPLFSTIPMTNYGPGTSYSLMCVINTHLLKMLRSEAPHFLGLQTVSILRYKLFKLAVNTKCPHNWSEYKRIQNEITTDLRQAKAMYFNDLFTEIKTTKAYWNLVRKATSPRQQTVVGPD